MRRRYTPLFEGKRTELLDQAEFYLNDKQPYAAIKHIAKAIGMNSIDKKHNDTLSKQVDEYLKSNSNSFAFISNIERILKGEKTDKLVKYVKPRKPSVKKGAVDKAVQQALQAQQDKNTIADETLKDVENDEDSNGEKDKEQVKEV